MLGKFTRCWPFVLLVLLAAPLQAQTYPARPIRVVVGFPPGGGDDFVARVVATRLAEVLGQQVIVDNRSGAGGIIGWEYVAKSPPDGYTLAFGGASMTLGQSLRLKMPYDVLRDFSPISLIGRTALVLVVHPSVPAKTVKDLMALARAQPGRLNFASSGVGAMPHLAGELFKSMAKLDIVHVPYKGAAGIYPDLISGRVDFYIPPTASAMPHIETGKLRALAVTRTVRVDALPQVPTFAEAALPGYEIFGWYAFHAPAGTSRDTLNLVNAAVRSVVAIQDVRARLAKVGIDPESNSPDQMAAMMKMGAAKFGKIIRDAGIKPE